MAGRGSSGYAVAAAAAAAAALCTCSLGSMLGRPWSRQWRGAARTTTRAARGRGAAGLPTSAAEKTTAAASILEYYIDFTWYFANLLFPIFLFLSVIWFTSKLANNTEVIAILSSGISFSRYLKPFLLSATFIAFFAFFAGMFIVPKSNEGFNDFRYKYLVKKEARKTDIVFQQINDNEYIYVNNYDPIRKQASNFTLEHFEGNTLKFKIKARRIRWIEKDSVFRLTTYKKRSFFGDDEFFEVKVRKDTIFDFAISDSLPRT